MAKQILIVDDDPDFVESTKIILSAHGYDVRTASDGKSALALLHKEKPDIILLDVMMRTKGEGVWFSQKLRSNKLLRSIPILMITAVNQDAEMKNFHLNPEIDGDYLPVDGFLEKPVEPEDILRKIVKLIGK
ncbi:response regulator [candidate division WOR-3 bacterium]|nr:response regulator [candidate division WOR-3 bacterium]